jgi:hypothetical protein
MISLRRTRHVVLACMAITALLGACGGTSMSSDAATGGTGGGGAGGAGGGTSCGTTACTANQVCVRTQTVGGAVNCPGDGGTCPVGYELMQGCCVAIPAWSCEARPSGCGTSVSCGCAAATFCTAGHTCTMPRDNEIDCTLLAP